MSVLSWRGWKPVNLMDAVLGSQKDDNARDEGVFWVFLQGPCCGANEEVKSTCLRDRPSEFKS